MESAPLLPRYTRPLGFGAVLDETIALYRRTWRSMVGILAICMIPAAIGFVVLAGSVGTVLLNPASGMTEQAAFEALVAGLAGGGGVLIVLVGASWVLAAAAVMRRTELAMRDMAGSAWACTRAGLRYVLPLIGSGILLVIGVLLWLLVSLPLFILGLFGILGGLIALVGLIVWLANPGARRPWLKWLIVLATPFGLAIYWSTRWYLAGAAVVVERLGPFAALKRSAALVKGHTLQVLGVVVMVGIVSSLLQGIPSLALGIVGFFLGLASGGDDALETAGGIANVLSNVGTLVGWVLFGAISYITSVLVFVDLRNRKEGTDLEERLRTIERVPPFSFA